jgi:hypothetical protein
MSIERKTMRQSHSAVRDLIRARSVNWQIVDSSNVHSALYNRGENDFYVRFLRSGPDDIYRYRDRTPSEWQGFTTALSKGSWIWENPRGENWPYELLTTRQYPTGGELDEINVPRATRDFLTPL